MKKRKLCILCVPVLLWFLITAIWEQEHPKDASYPWREGTRLEVAGTIERIQTKEKNQTIVIKNISIFTKDTDKINSVSSISADSADTIFGIKIQMQHPEEVQIGNYIKVSGICQYFDSALN